MLRRPAAVVAVALALCIAAYAPAQTKHAGVANDELNDSLKTLGYSVVPLKRMVSGHLIATVRINGSDNLRFVCDSGSYGTLISPQTCESLGLKSRDSGKTVGGLGGAGLAVAKAKVKTFQIGFDKQAVSEILVIDISHVNQQFRAIGEEPVHGIIGSDWMAAHQALLDVANKRMFFKSRKPNQPKSGNITSDNNSVNRSTPVLGK